MTRRRADPGWIRSALDRFERPLVVYAQRIVGDLDRARDVVQDAFLQLCDADSAKVDPHLAAWLYTVTRNRALDVRREARRGAVASNGHVEAHAAPESEAGAALSAGESLDRVRALIAILSEDRQEVVRLRFEHGLTYREIAEVTSLSVSNVGVLLHTALKEIRNRIAASDRLAARGGHSKVRP
ncbi:MAG TPA: sigma-70 family RNA polymerase sigma factor [Planctomycetota bacterium]|nr:sigma-70 family RNA polymerase sigma factor [Planctomycetota bacterium]